MDTASDNINVLKVGKWINEISFDPGLIHRTKNIATQYKFVGQIERNSCNCLQILIF